MINSGAKKLYRVVGNRESDGTSYHAYPVGTVIELIEELVPEYLADFSCPEDIPSELLPGKVLLAGCPQTLFMRDVTPVEPEASDV